MTPPTAAQTPAAGSNAQRTVQRLAPAVHHRTQGRTATERAADSAGSMAPVTVAQDQDVGANLIRTHASIPADDALQSLAGAEGPRTVPPLPEAPANAGSGPDAHAGSYVLIEKGAPYQERVVQPLVVDILV